MAAAVSTNRRWPIALVIILAVYLAAAAALASQLPVKDGMPDWFATLFPAAGWPGPSPLPCSS